MPSLELDLSPWLAALPLAAVPEISAELVIRIVSRVIHILSAMILGGGIFYLKFVLAQAGPEACFAGRRPVWARWVGIASGLLLVTGLYNFIVIVRQSKTPGAEALPLAYHLLFGIKFLTGLAVMAVASIISGSTAAAESARGKLTWWLNMAALGVLATVILGAILRVFHP